MRIKRNLSIESSQKIKMSQKPVRLKQPTFEKLTELISKANEKEGGKRIKTDDVLGLALSLLTQIRNF